MPSGQCETDQRSLAITNQDAYPLMLTFSTDDTDSNNGAVETYEAQAARLDEETAVYVPTTTHLCIAAELDGDLTIRYTQGSKCIHRVFLHDQWSAAGFTYTVPAWNPNDPGEVCRVASNAHSNKNARNNDAPTDDDEPPGASNEQWWRWFWARQGKRSSNVMHMAAMALTAFVVLVALIWYLMSRR